MEDIKTFLEELGTKGIPHSKGSFYEHLVRVGEIVERLYKDEVAIKAAMCHSLYSTEFFTQEVLSINDRSKLSRVIGKEAEELVYYFCLMDRKSFKEDKKGFSFTDRVSKEEITIPYIAGKRLLHILFANQLDHIDHVRVGISSHLFEDFRNLYPHLSGLAKFELEKLIDIGGIPASDTHIQFIAHSGVRIFNKKTSVLVDPWVYDSLRESPLIDSLDPTQKTIDYLIPEPKTAIKEITSTIICLSHFHTHHSPLREIVELAKIQPIKIICPPLGEAKRKALRQKIGDYIFERIEFIIPKNGQEIFIDDVLIIPIIHRDQGMPHIGYYVQLEDKSFLHIVDATSDVRNKHNKEFSSFWDNVYMYRPTVLFIGAAGHISKHIEKGERSVTEAETLTPVQAAIFASRILPKIACVIGVYNHSVWDDRFEMGTSLGDIEASFYFTLSYLAPSVRVRKVFPGEILC